MSITSIITSLQSAISDAYTALAAKGATMPTNKNTDELADLIAALSVSSGSEIFGDPSKLTQGSSASSNLCDAIIFYVSGKNNTVSIKSYSSSGANAGTIKQYSASFMSTVSSTVDPSSSPGSSDKTFTVSGTTSGTTILAVFGIAYASPGYHLKVTDCQGTNAKYLCINPTS